MTHDECRKGFEKYYGSPLKEHDAGAFTMNQLVAWNAYKAAYNAPRIASKGMVEKVARAIFQADKEAGAYCWQKYSKKYYFPMAQAALRAAGFVIEGE